MSVEAPTAVLLLAAPLSTRVINLERKITNGGVRSASDISKERGIAHGIVTESVVVIVERKGADSIVE